jgi:stalled ribosome rescue protein Dom34
MKAKNLGIWMDHSTAHLIELTTEPIKIKTILSSFTHDVKESTLSKNENLMHNKEQQQQSGFYKKLMDEIKNYEHIVLFGPTEAKSELHNLINADHNFAKIKIVVKPADKMTENQQKAFVIEYFANHLLLS